MVKKAFAAGFGGMLGVLFAIVVFCLGIPIMACSGCFGTLVFFGDANNEINKESKTNNSPSKTSSGSSSKKNPNSEAGKQESDSDAKSKSPKGIWVPILKASGKGQKKTEAFVVKDGDNVVLKYVYSDTSKIGAVVFSVSVRDFNTDKIADLFAVSETGDSNSDNTRLKLKPGSYYLDVNAANCLWEIDVVEYLDEKDDRARLLLEKEAAKEKARMDAEAEQRKADAIDTELNIKRIKSEIERKTEELDGLTDVKPYPNRKWQSKDKTYSVNGAFVESVEYKTLKLKKEITGEVISVERKKLCNADLVYLAELKKTEDARKAKLKSLPDEIKSLTEKLKSLTEKLKSLKDKK